MGRPGGHQEYRSMLLLGRSCTCVRGPGSAVSAACQSPDRLKRKRTAAPLAAKNPVLVEKYLYQEQASPSSARLNDNNRRQQKTLF